MLRLFDSNARNSFTTKLRKKRFRFFLNELTKLPRPLKILDIGGSQLFWDLMEYKEDDDVTIYLLNLRKQDVTRKNFESIIGDATDLSEFENNSSTWFFQIQ